MVSKKLSKKQKQVWTILSTPDDIDFRKFREEHDDFWLTKEREVLHIGSMETKHVISAINMLERCGQSDTKAYDGLCSELTRRYGNDRWKYEN
jgi:hypothetical protein